jgi:hypothetical protein
VIHGVIMVNATPMQDKTKNITKEIVSGNDSGLGK